MGRDAERPSPIGRAFGWLLLAPPALRELLIEGHLAVQRPYAIADGGSGFIEHEHSSFGRAEAAVAASG